MSVAYALLQQRMRARQEPTLRRRAPWRVRSNLSLIVYPLLGPNTLLDAIHRGYYVGRERSTRVRSDDLLDLSNLARAKDDRIFRRQLA